MFTSIINSLIILLSMLAASAFFSAAETAITSLSDLQISIIKASHPLRGKALTHLYTHRHLLLGSTLIGNNAANFILSAEATKVSLELFGNQALALTTGALIFIVLIFSEITPKQLAFQFNQRFINVFIFPIFAFYYIFLPISYILSVFSNLLKKSFPTHNKEITNLSESQYVKLFNQAKKSGSLDPEDARMLTRVLSISHVPVHQISTHRTEVISVSSKMSLQDMKDYLATQKKQVQFIPVYELDNKEHIIGLLHVYDIIHHSNKDIHDFLIPPVFVTENKVIEDVMHIIRQKPHHLAIVLDEYGGLQGLISMTDIVNYIFEEHRIASNISHVETHSDIVQISAQQYLLKERAEISDIIDIADNISIDTTIESRTVSGYIPEITGEIPSPHKVIETPFGDMKILEVKKNRITSILWTINKK